MAEKNAYEIRADILTLAKEYWDSQAALNAEYAEKIRTGLITQALTPVTPEALRALYTPYTMEDIMKTAQTMYDFVQRGQRS